jgi:hypothetical protein
MESSPLNLLINFPRYYVSITHRKPLRRSSWSRALRIVRNSSGPPRTAGSVPGTRRQKSSPAQTSATPIATSEILRGAICVNAQKAPLYAHSKRLGSIIFRFHHISCREARNVAHEMITARIVRVHGVTAVRCAAVSTSPECGPNPG